MLVDTHCHLTDQQFANDLDAVLGRAREAGVERILTLGTDVHSSRAAIQLAEKYESFGVFAAVGIHPESVREAKDSDLDALRECAHHPRVVAIGEIGLDYYWDRTTIDLQQAWFERQLALAAELGLPVSIHDREAHDKIFDTLQKTGNMGVRGVLHSFSGDVTLARKAVQLGFKISFAGPLTFSNAKQPPTVAQAIGIENILIETDSPYLSPQPLRGKRNEPMNVGYVAKRLAELKAMDIEELCRLISQTSSALLHW